MVSWIVVVLAVLVLFWFRRTARKAAWSVPHGAPAIALLLALVAMVLFLNFRDLKDWQDSDLIDLADFVLWLGIVGWLLWPRQSED